MDDRIRISDADRDRVTARLRDHFAEGRLTTEELDERITATLNAKTFGDLRRVMADLPGPPPWQPQAPPPWPPPPWHLRRRGPRVLPLVLLLLLAAVLTGGGGWVFLAIVKMVLLFVLVVSIVGMVAAGSFRRRMRRGRQAGRPYRWHPGWHDHRHW